MCVCVRAPKRSNKASDCPKTTPRDSQDGAQYGLKAIQDSPGASQGVRFGGGGADGGSGRPCMWGGCLWLWWRGGGDDGFVWLLCFGCMCKALVARWR